MGFSSAFKGLIYTPDGETPHGRYWRGQEDNIKVDLKVQWCEDDWISLYRRASNIGLLLTTFHKIGNVIERLTVRQLVAILSVVRLWL